MDVPRGADAREEAPLVVHQLRVTVVTCRERGEVFPLVVVHDVPEERHAAFTHVRRVHRDLGDVRLLGLVEIAQADEVVGIGALAVDVEPEIVLVVVFVTRDDVQVVVVPRILVAEDRVVGLRHAPGVVVRTPAVLVPDAGFGEVGLVRLLDLGHVHVEHSVEFEREVLREVELQTLVEREAVVGVAAVEEVLCCRPVAVFPVRRADDLLAVEVVLAHGRGCRVHDAEEVLLAAADVVRNPELVRLAEVERRGGFEPRRDLVGAVAEHRDALVLGDHRETLLVVVADAGVILAAVVSARCRDVVVLGDGHVAHRDVPRGEFIVDDRLARDRVDHALVALVEQEGVLVGEEHRAVDTLGRGVSVRFVDVARAVGARGRERGRIARTVGRQPQVIEVVVGREELRGIAQVAQTHLGLERDLGHAAFSLLGGHQHHARVGLGTIECRGGGVLQDLDRLDVVAVDVREVRFLDAVDHVERRTAAVEGRTAADDDRGRRSGLSGRRGDARTRDASREGLQHVAVGAALQHLARHLRDGRRQLVLGHRLPVTRDDHFVDVERVLLQRDVDLRTVPRRQILPDVPQAAERQDRIRLADGQRVVAFAVGDRTVGRTLFDDGHADHRIPRRIENPSRNPDLSLGRHVDRHEQAYRCQCSGYQPYDVFHDRKCFIVRTSSRNP